jgi:fatty acid desaturase
MNHPPELNANAASVVRRERQSSGISEIIAAYGMVRDLMEPRPARYWGELLLEGTAAWLAFALDFGSVGMWLALTAATLLFFRISIFIHELTHRQPQELPGFRLAWNLSVGVPLLLPSVMYEGVHQDHHSKTTYGTADDPEYIPFASQPVMAVSLVLLSIIVPLHLAVRFLIDAPISWVAPPFRRWLLMRGTFFGFNPYYRRKITAAARRSLFHWEVIILAVWLPALTATLAGWLPWRWVMLWYGMHATIAVINHWRDRVAHRYRSDGVPLNHADQLRDSVDTPGAWWTALWAPLGLRFHALHHLFPRLPYHNLAQAHARLMQQLPTDAIYRQSQNSSLANGLRQLLH